jgi:magnesium chelatase family protein
MSRGSLKMTHSPCVETPEFGHRALAALRQPVDDGQVRLTGSGGATVTYPAQVHLVIAAQSCPCGRSTGGESCCGCTSRDRARYMARMSALWRRTDIRLRLEIPAPQDGDAGESSAVVAERVARARELAADRWAALNHRSRRVRHREQPDRHRRAARRRAALR